MNKNILLSIIFILLFASLTAQRDNLSDQEQRVIKSYQFDLEKSKPILSDIILEIPKMEFANSKIEVDLLPVQLEEVTYSIMPVAYEPTSSKYYKGYAKGAFGTAQILDLEVSYRHQAPNYFMYGLDVNYSNIADKNVLSKEVNEKEAKAFLRYYAKPKFWFEVESGYQFNKMGVFGFNEDQQNGSSGGEILEENYRKNYYQLEFFKRFTNVNTDIHLTNSLLSAKNTRMNLGENIVNNQLNINTKVSDAFSIELSSVHDRQISTINKSDNTYLWNNSLNLAFSGPKLGMEIGGLYSFSEDKKLLPEAEFYLKGKRHSLTAFYKNDLSLNTFYSNLDEINLIHISDYNSLVTWNNTYGLEYRFELENTHNLKIRGSHVNLENDQIWINASEDRRYFSSLLLDYSYYSLGLEYEISLLKNLSFGQSVDYNLLDELQAQEIPHFQRYNLTSSISYRLGKLTFSADYILGDKVFYIQDLDDYAESSTYQHDVQLLLKYEVSNAVNLSIKGIDLLDNRFERYAGYQDFGRRATFNIMAKF